MSARRRRIGAVAVLGVLVLAVVAYLVLRGGGGGGTKATSTTVPSLPHGSIPPPSPGTGESARLSRTPGATSVKDHGAKGDGAADDSAAFTAAMDAARSSSVRFPGGPGGRPQAVVYVPPGTYRIVQLRFPDDTRLEVDAAAVLEPIERGTLSAGQTRKGPALIVWDGDSGDKPLTNVSLVGVGAGGGPLKDLAAPVETGWDLGGSFTMDLDAARTGGDNDLGGVMMLGVKGFLVQNVYSIQNASIPDRTGDTAKNGQYPWPTSSRAVFVLRPRNDSPKDGPFHDPQDGAIRHHYNVNSPYGYGPNQITSGHNVEVSDVYSRGGTALRLETDATLKKDFGGEIRGLVARDILGVDCNRALSFAPHGQRNYDVHVTGVIARGCHQGVIESVDEKLGREARGGFWSSTVSGVQVIGAPTAQDPAPERRGVWEKAASQQAYARDKGVDWSVQYSDARCSGDFSSDSDAIDVGGKFERPTCT